MNGKRKKSGYDTNLASEFYVLSCLHRLGVTASLTLGNKKGVDILVAREAGDSITVEVKGVAKRYDWPVNNLPKNKPHNHFVVLVSFDGKIAEANMPSPKVWIIPMGKIGQFVIPYNDGKMNVVSRSKISKNGSEFENAWHFIEPRIKNSQ